MIFFVFFFISCEKQYKKKNSYESLNEKKQNVEVSNKMTFNEANKLLSNNAMEHKYHWYKNADGSDGGLLVIEKSADIEWIKLNLLPAFQYIHAIELKNTNLTLLPFLQNCNIASVYNKNSDETLDLLSFPKTYKHLTFYDCSVKNLSHLQDYNNLTLLDLDCKMEDLKNTSSNSINQLTIRTNDVFDFSVTKNFPNLTILKLEEVEDICNINQINNTNINVLWIKNEKIYFKHKAVFDEMKNDNKDLKIWYGLE